MASQGFKVLIDVNRGILRHKICLLDLLESKFGNESCSHKFKLVCPILKASIGQHYRHSTDHMELPILMAYSGIENGDIHYDLRVRGGTLEKDVSEAKKRLISIDQILKDTINRYDTNSNLINQLKINSYFILSGDINTETQLHSSLGRELGFAAHHAIHHLAMVKIIATQTLGISEDELPRDFGMAPSTVNYQRTIS